MEKMAHSPGVGPKTPPQGSAENVTSDDDGGGSRGRSAKSHGSNKLVRGMKKLLSVKRKKRESKEGSKEGCKETCNTASTCSSSSRRSDGQKSPKSPHHGGGPHHIDSLEPVGHPKKVDDKELKEHHDLIAKPGPKKSSKNIPDAGVTTLAFTVFENDDNANNKNAHIASVHEKEGKLHYLGEEKQSPKKKREKKESGKSGKSVETFRKNSAGKSVEPTRRNSKPRGRTKESPASGGKSRSPTTPRGTSREPGRKTSRENVAHTPRSSGSK